MRDVSQKLYSMEDVRQRLGISQSTFYRWIREGRFPRPRRIGAEWKYTESDWSAYVMFGGRWGPGPFDEDEKTPKGREKKQDSAESDAD